MYKLILAVIILLSNQCNCNSNEVDTLYDNVIVTELTPQTFTNEVINDTRGSVWIVVFYAPWCYYSQDLVPEFTSAARALRGVVEFGAVNGDKYENLRQQYGVEGFPFIKIFGRDKQIPFDFYGARRSKDLIYAGWAAELNNWFIEI